MILANLRAGIWRYSAFALGVLAVALLITGLVFRVRAADAVARADAAEQRAQASEAQLQAVNVAREKERLSAVRANAIASQYEQDKINAEALASQLAADVRTGRVLLQKRWACDASPVAGTPGEPDAAPDDRAESAARIVQAARDADSQIRGLQELVKSDRQ